MQHPPFVNADTITYLIQQHRLTRNSTSNKHLVTCRTCDVPIPQGEGQRWYTLPYRYIFLCPKCDNRWRAEARTVPSRE